MMDFEGKEMVRKSIAQNLNMWKQLSKMQEQLTLLAKAAAKENAAGGAAQSTTPDGMQGDGTPSGYVLPNNPPSGKPQAKAPAAT